MRIRSFGVLTLVGFLAGACEGSENSEDDSFDLVHDSCLPDRSGYRTIDGILESSTQMAATLVDLESQLLESVEELEKAWGLAHEGSLAARMADLLDVIRADVEQNSGQPLTVYLPTPTCASDSTTMLGAYHQCLVYQECGDDFWRVEIDPTESYASCDGTCLGECSGKCAGVETCRSTAADTSCSGTCSGACETTAASHCLGVCRGTCSGLCTAYDSEAGCAGYCEGECTGICEQHEDASCPGGCTGHCTDATVDCTQQKECDGLCGGTCAGTCQGRWTPENFGCDNASRCIPMAQAVGLASYGCKSFPIEFGYAFPGLEEDSATYSNRMATLELHLSTLYDVFNLYSALSDHPSDEKTIEPPLDGISSLLDELVRSAIDSTEGPFEAVPLGRRNCIIPVVEIHVTELGDASASISPNLQALSDFIEAARAGFAPAE